MKLTESHGREEFPLEKNAKPVALRCSAGLSLCAFFKRIILIGAFAEEQKAGKIT
jgi:hypothetical protein